MIELNTTIEAKLDVILTRMNNQERRDHSTNEVELWKVLSKKVFLIKDLLKRFHTRLRKLSI